MKIIDYIQCAILAYFFIGLFASVAMSRNRKINKIYNEKVPVLGQGQLDRFMFIAFNWFVLLGILSGKQWARFIVGCGSKSRSHNNMTNRPPE